MKYLFFCLFIFINVFANQDFKIISPKNHTIYKEAFASIVVNLPTKSLANKIVIKSQNKKYELKINKKRDTYCKNIHLNIGVNKIEVIAYKDKKILKSEFINIFYNSEVFKAGVNIPNEFNINFFHNNKNENSCKKCHNMKKDNNIIKKDGNSLLTILDNPKKSNCFNCHKNLLSRKNSHAPSINLACIQCHSGETEYFNKEMNKKSIFIAPDPIDNKCFSCHEKIKDSWYNKDSKHGPVMTGRCTKCHNPHSSNNEFFLRKPIWKLCTTCHDEKATGKHVLSSFVFGRNKGAHPTQHRKDPARPGRELVCSSCHNPHGSDGIYLLRTQGKSSYSICKRCHQK